MKQGDGVGDEERQVTQHLIGQDTYTHRKVIGQLLNGFKHANGTFLFQKSTFAV